MNRTTIPLPKDLKNQLKIKASNENMSMGKFIARALKEYLELTSNLPSWNLFKAQAEAKNLSLSDFFEEIHEFYNKNYWKKTKRNSYAKKVKEFIKTSSELFTTNDVYQTLGANTRQEKKAIVKCLLRLKEKGVIKKTGRMAGEYMLIKREV